MPPPNIFSADFAYDDTDPAGYRCGAVDIGQQAGARENAVKAFELPAGQSVCPYHYEYVEEWLLVLDGTVELRGPDGERPLHRGDMMCFAPGPAGAHKVTNREAATARLLMFSSARTPAVAVYPDSDKLGVWTGHEADHVILRRADGHSGYYDGEV